jgi:drug/metabolite transporter (DMT)-like permease
MNNRLEMIKALLALLLLSILWGYNWVVMKFALEDAGAFQFGAMRTFFGALCLMLLLLCMRKPMKPEQIPSLIVLGILQTCGFTGMIIWALVEGGAGKTAVLTYTMPFWVMLLAWPLLKERIHGIQWIAGLLMVVGLTFIFDPTHLGKDRFSMILAILGGVSWALAVILAKRMHHRHPNMDLIAMTAWQMLFGSIPLVVVAWLVEAPAIHWTGNLISAVVFNAVFCNALAWLLWLYALRRLAAGVASMTSMLAPLIGVIAAWMQLGEVPTVLEGWGMVLIAIALVLISYHAIKQHEEIDSAMGQD